MRFVNSMGFRSVYKLGNVRATSTVKCAFKKMFHGQQAAWPALGFSQFYVDSDYICNSVELEQFTAARRSVFSQFPVTISLLAIVNPPVQLLVHITEKSWSSLSGSLICPISQG